jgi:hypothetical protein
MEVYRTIAGALSLLVVICFRVLEGMHHVSAIKEHFPRLYRVMSNGFFQTVLLMIGLGLLAENLVEWHSEGRSEASKPAPPVEPKAPSSAPAPSPRVATSTGDQSPAIAGDGNSVEYGDGSLKKKQSPKSVTSTTH